MEKRFTRTGVVNHDRCCCFLMRQLRQKRHLFSGRRHGHQYRNCSAYFCRSSLWCLSEENDLAFDQFPHPGLIKTYNTDAQVPDSAGTITAITTAEKTRIGVLGIKSNNERDDCAEALNTLPTLAELPEQRGISTGIVSTARITLPHLPGPMLIVPIETGKAAPRLRMRPRHLDAGILLYNL